jgi:hypothetical protein
VLELHPGAPPFSLRRHVSLRHRNLLRVFHIGQLGGDLTFLCHERPGGLTLRELRQGGPLPFELAIEVLRQVAAGLAAVHQAGLCHGRVHGANVYDREDGQVALGPPRVAGSAVEGEAAAQSDLRQLAALFAELLFEEGTAPGELGAALRRLSDPQAPAPRGTFELYAMVEAAAAKDGLLESMEDSSSIRLPGGPAPGPGAQGKAAAGAFRQDDDDTTIEMEKLDTADLPDFAAGPQAGQSLYGLVGPLERRGAQKAEGDTEEDEDEGLRTVPVLRLDGDTPAAAVPKTKPAPAPSLWVGPARWLVPLGVATLLVLLLAAWVVLRAP